MWSNSPFLCEQYLLLLVDSAADPDQDLECACITISRAALLCLADVPSSACDRTVHDVVFAHALHNKCMHRRP